MTTIRYASVLALGLTLAACPKKEETDQGAFSKTQPSAASSQPAQAEKSPHGDMKSPHGEMKSPHGDMKSPPPHGEMQAPPHGQQPAQAAHNDVPDAPPFGGEIKLGAGLGKDAVKPSDVLFVIARQSMGGQPGQIIATQRHTPVTLPMKFTMSKRDTMVEGIPFTGPWIVTVRLDRDGDPMTKDENDLYASSNGEVKGGQTDLSMVLSKGMPAPAQAPKSPH